MISEPVASSLTAGPPHLENASEDAQDWAEKTETEVKDDNDELTDQGDQQSGDATETGENTDDGDDSVDELFDDVASGQLRISTASYVGHVSSLHYASDQSRDSGDSSGRVESQEAQDDRDGFQDELEIRG